MPRNNRSNNTESQGFSKFAASSGSTEDFPEHTHTPAVSWNPISDYEEPIEFTNLTLYDTHRLPLEVDHDASKRIILPLQDLTSEFQCPICLGYMKKTSIVMECLHRFCYDCIQKSLRVGRKECPSCRIHIPSRRSLRADPAFDLLIENIYGDINSFEEQEEKNIETLNKQTNMNNAQTESRKRAIALQQMKNRYKKSRVSLATSNNDDEDNTINATATTTMSEIDDSNNRRSSRQEQDQIFSLSNNNYTTEPQDNSTIVIPGEKNPKVDFYLLKSPDDTCNVPALRKSHISVNGEFTIAHVKKFLSIKLSYCHNNLQIICDIIPEVSDTTRLCELSAKLESDKKTAEC